MIRTLPRVLERARTIVTPELGAAIERLAPVVRRPALYHCGFIDVDGRPTNGGGKHVRAALALLSAGAVGADEIVAIPGAVAIELVHNFSLLHDDIIDNDRERRHRPTVWALFGVGSAIVTGDALNSLSVQVLLEAPAPFGARAASTLVAGTAEMIKGEGQDVEFETRDDVSLAECLDMTMGKTGALLGAACAMGAILGGGEDRAIAALDDFGRHLGVAFQAVDDLLGIWGDPAVTGKPVFSDLRQNKKSIPIIAATTAAGTDRQRLIELIKASATSAAVAARAAAMIDDLGGRTFTQNLADEQFHAALHSLERAAPVPAAGDELEALAGFVVDRDQ